MDAAVIETGDIAALALAAGRLHLQFVRALELDIAELGYDIAGVRALMVLRLGRDELTPGQLLHGGVYVGSNLSYNLNQLVKDGWWIEAEGGDRRTKLIRNSARALKLCDDLADPVAKYEQTMGALGVDSDILLSCSKTLKAVRVCLDNLRTT